MIHDIHSSFKKTFQMYELEAAKNQPIDQIVREALDGAPDRDSAAELLGVSRQTLWDWLKRLEMKDLIRNYHRNGNGATCKEV